MVDGPFTAGALVWAGVYTRHCDTDRLRVVYQLKISDQGKLCGWRMTHPILHHSTWPYRHVLFPVVNLWLSGCYEFSFANITILMICSFGDTCMELSESRGVS